MGGDFILNSQGLLTFVNRSKNVRDRPTVDQLLKVLTPTVDEQLNELKVWFNTVLASPTPPPPQLKTETMVFLTYLHVMPKIGKSHL